MAVDEDTLVSPRSPDDSNPTDSEEIEYAQDAHGPGDSGGEDRPDDEDVQHHDLRNTEHDTGVIEHHRNDGGENSEGKAKQLDSDSCPDSPPHHSDVTTQHDADVHAQAASNIMLGSSGAPEHVSATRYGKKKDSYEIAKASHKRRAAETIAPEHYFKKPNPKPNVNPKVSKSERVYAKHFLTTYQEHDDWLTVSGSMCMFSDGSEKEGLAPKLLRDRNLHRLLILSDDQGLLHVIAQALDAFDQIRSFNKLASPRQVSVKRSPKALQVVCQEIFEQICAMKSMNIMVQLGKVSGSSVCDSDSNVVADALAKYARTNAFGRKHLEELHLPQHLVTNLQQKAKVARRKRTGREQQLVALSLQADHGIKSAGERRKSASSQASSQVEDQSWLKTAFSKGPRIHTGITEKFLAAAVTGHDTMDTGGKRVHHDDAESNIRDAKRKKMADWAEELDEPLRG
ncbi:hypothetical protein EJ03DRAFT_340170 [Teratosphaeria nubilosa]|uniref:Uncharacterized protein n=1 Tax=Teratosphaeria nubilosa TaxID=161662 RepID=A0A6G1KUR7_9PEZI|nr:hypothetical protein EJ03DRAFT_340170 [Teratosphaeria nubilosa]